MRDKVLARRDVLDHGFVELLEQMGDDSAPAKIARVSRRGLVQESSEEEDIRLTRGLLTSTPMHGTPFEFLEFWWHMKLPVVVARQWVRHRTATINERSMRQKRSGKDLDFFMPARWRGRVSASDQVNRTRAHEELRLHILQVYDDDIAARVTPEQARIDLPLSLYTTWIWKCDLRNTLHLLGQRLAKDAQWETRQYAEAMHDILCERIPAIMSIWQELHKELFDE